MDTGNKRFNKTLSMSALKQYTTTIYTAIIIAGALLCINANATSSPPLKIGDSFYSFFWTQSAGNTNDSGYYGLLSITAQQQTSSAISYSAKFNLDRCSWWQTLVAKTYSDIAIVFSNSKPDSVLLCSGRFAAVPWLQSITGQTDTSSYLLRFYFPVLPINQIYKRYDYFCIRYNDSINIQFQANSDSIFSGSFASSQPGKPTILYAKNAITVITTSKNNLRIKNLQVKGEYEKLVSSYFKFDLSKLKKSVAYYGIDILDTLVPEQNIQVKSVTLSGAPNIFADSTYRLSWSFVAANKVDRCSLYVALDSGVTWTPVGMTSGSDSSFMWTAPHKASQHCFIKVRATGKDGQKAEGISAKFAITINGPDDTVIPPENNYLLQASILDSATVRLAWSPQGTRDPRVSQITILFDTLHFPSSKKDSLAKTVGLYGISKIADTIKNLQQSRTYYFSLFVADTANNWSLATPNSMARVRLSSTKGQSVVIGIDTQHVLNDSLLIWSTIPLITPYYDTLDPWDGPPDKHGFVQTGPGFAFRQGRLPANTTIGLKITYRSISLPLKPFYQRLYRYNIFTGKWRINEAPFTIDTINHSFSTTCKDLSLPFMVMIDTLAPVSLERLNYKKAFSANERIVDTVFENDNVENVTFRLLAAPGKSSYSDISLYVTSGQNPGDYITSIPPYIADQNTGLRSILVIDDGRNADTTNLSRPIWREGTNCDDTIAKGIQWTPLFVTAQPENPVLSAALSSSTDPSTPLAYNKEMAAAAGKQRR